MLDGAARLGELFDETERLGMPALATTDHGYLFGAFDFWSKATAAGIKPIIGIEAYVTPGTSRFDQTRVRFGQQGQEQDGEGFRRRARAAPEGAKAHGQDYSPGGAAAPIGVSRPASRRQPPR